jgi:hypothetical protein
VTRDTSFARAHRIHLIALASAASSTSPNERRRSCTVRIDEIVVVRTDGAPLITLLDTTVMEHCAQRNVLLESTKKFAVCLGARAILFEVLRTCFICVVFEIARH